MRRRFINNTKIRFDFNNYLSFESLEDGLIIIFPKDLEYGIDGLGWKLLKGNIQSPAFNKGQIISFKAELEPDESIGVGSFYINKKVRLLGNCNSILFSDNARNRIDVPKKAFSSLFSYSTGIVSVSSDFLPATELSDDCYSYMFQGCTGLTQAPELPATTLASYCYRFMFEGCTSLVNAPELPATTLASYCYISMFSGCTNLNYIKALFTTTPSNGYTSYWVSGVADTGTFVKSKDATWDVTGVNGVPSGWTVITDDQESGGGEVSKQNNYISIVISPSGRTHDLDISCTYPIASNIRFQCNVIDFNTMQPTIEYFTLSQGFQSGVVTVTYLSDNDFVITPIEDDTYIYEIIYA